MGKIVLFILFSLEGGSQFTYICWGKYNFEHKNNGDHWPGPVDSFYILDNIRNLIHVCNYSKCNFKLTVMSMQSYGCCGGGGISATDHFFYMYMLCRRE